MSEEPRYDDVRYRQSSVKIVEKREDARNSLAHLFMFGYVVIIGMLIVFTTFFELKPDTAKDYLLAVGSPLGLVIAFYFKSAGRSD